VSFDAIQAAAQVQASGALSVSTGGAAASIRMPSAATGGFGEMVAKGIGEVNQQLLVAQTDLQQLATGNVQNLHQIMIRLEESRMSFQLMLQVRNRLLEAYQEVMKMQV
jgi:flagellar hook-basal body complex protein FliE